MTVAHLCSKGYVSPHLITDNNGLNILFRKAFQTELTEYKTWKLLADVHQQIKM